MNVAGKKKMGSIMYFLSLPGQSFADFPRERPREDGGKTGTPLLLLTFSHWVFGGHLTSETRFGFRREGGDRAGCASDHELSQAA